VKLAKNTNILIHEATFTDSLSDKAEETGHSTAKIAARVANEAKTKLLVITHFSARYNNEYVLLREARDDFFPAWIATELRPIFTDPAHEKGIIERRTYLKEIDSDNGKSKKKRKKRKTKRRVRKRKKVEKNKSDRSSGKRRKRIKKKDDKPSNDSNNNNNGNNGDDQPQPKPLTPRTPFDDFDRF